MLGAEAAEHGDLVVVRGADAYRNLPNKTVRLLRYMLSSARGCVSWATFFFFFFFLARFVSEPRQILTIRPVAACPTEKEWLLLRMLSSAPARSHVCGPITSILWLCAPA